MRRLLLATALLTSCSLLAACQPKRVVEHLPTPPERLVCEAAPADRPALPPEHTIDWSKVTTVPQARAQHDAYVHSVRTREGVVAGYLVQIEQQLFTCWLNARWRRDYEAGLGN